MGENSHPSDATNITVLQSFCDSTGGQARTSFNLLFSLYFLGKPLLSESAPRRWQDVAPFKRF
jgi:hypothetical protein